MTSFTLSHVVLAGLTVVLLASGSAVCKDKQVVNVECRKWLSKVDLELGSGCVQLASFPSDREVLEAIGCLLQLQGDKRPARFGGATRADVSQILPSSTIELAALYYISYLYNGHWQHADGVALWDRKGTINPPGSIKTAYAAYRKWFQKVKAIGIVSARARHMEPLAGTNLKWYGK